MSNLDYRFGLSYENKVPISNFVDFDMTRDQHHLKEFHELFNDARIKDRTSILIPMVYFIPLIKDAKGD